MNKLITLLLLLSICFLYSCADRSYTGSYYIGNQSTHRITLEFYDYGELNNSFSLNQEEEDLLEVTVWAGIREAPIYTNDSIVVTYDDSISFTHLNIQSELTGRNIYWNQNWQILKDQKYRKDWEYVFTDDDYEEALSNQ